MASSSDMHGWSAFVIDSDVFGMKRLAAEGSEIILICSCYQRYTILSERHRYAEDFRSIGGATREIGAQFVDRNATFDTLLIRHDG